MDIRVAAYGVIVEDGRILLAHWSQTKNPAWTMPGGGIDPGEDPKDAVVREVFEETGFEVEVDELLGIDSYVIDGSRRMDAASAGTPLHALRIVYRAHIVGGRLRNEVGGSTDRAEWFALDAVAGLTKVSLVNAALKLAGIATS